MEEDPREKKQQKKREKGPVTPTEEDLATHPNEYYDLADKLPHLIQRAVVRRERQSLPDKESHTERLERATNKEQWVRETRYPDSEDGCVMSGCYTCVPGETRYRLKGTHNVVACWSCFCRRDDDEDFAVDTAQAIKSSFLL